MALWENAEIELAQERLRLLGLADDAEFVALVRKWETELPWLRVWNCWHDGVRRELDMRLLLKGK